MRATIATRPRLRTTMFGRRSGTTAIPNMSMISSSLQIEIPTGLEELADEFALAHLPG
jgi:hypothetical protein